MGSISNLGTKKISEIKHGYVMYKEHNERSQHMGLGTSMECFWKMWVGIHMDKDFLIYGYGEEVGRSMVYGTLRTHI